MKVSIPFVVVSAVKDKAYCDICFVDAQAKRPCVELCKDAGYRPLESRSSVAHLDIPYTEATGEVLFTDVVARSGASMAWDDNTLKALPFKAVEEGGGVDG